MARGISFALLIVAAGAANFACVGEDPDPVPTTPSPEAGTPTGGGENLLSNGGFENGCGAPFFSSNADLTEETATKLTGGKSCKVCKKADANETNYSIYAYVDVEPKAGEVYTVSAQMRKVQNVEPGRDGLISIIGMDSTGSPLDGPDEGASKNTPAIVDNWTQGSTTWTAKPGALRLRVQLGLAASDPGNCFLVDDFVVTVTKK